MKKLVKFLLPFLVCSSAFLTSCKSDTRVYIEYGDPYVTETTVLSLNELDAKLKNKETFLFVVNSNTCGCWTDFEAIINSFINENKVPCYRIDYNTIKDVYTAFNIPYISSSTTTFVIYENGEIKQCINSDEQSNIMRDKKTFAKYINENVILPGCYLITKEQYHSIKESGKNAVVYFLRSECGDCKAINPGILKKYVANHQGANKIYCLDCQPYWRASSAEDYQSYLDIKDELGLSTKNNPTFGYGKGVFPYFSYIENCTYASGAVIYNDTITKEDDKYTITESYYSKQRVSDLSYTKTVLEGKRLKESQLNIGYGISWKHENADKYYGKILNSFLDYALPKVTYNF